MTLLLTHFFLWVFTGEYGLNEPRRSENIMKIETLKQRLDKNRPMITVTLRIPEDVVEELKQLAPILGFSGYQPLIRAYIGQGMRTDLEKLENNTVNALIASLKRHGVSDDIIHEALNEVVSQ